MEALRSIHITAERLGVSPWTIRSWASNGRLKSVKLGSRRMIPESEILRIISEGLGARHIQENSISKELRKQK
jgi:excisionase family DNA binding protein